MNWRLRKSVARRSLQHKVPTPQKLLTAQYLYQPDLDAYPNDNSIAANFDKRWPEVSGVFYQTITRLGESLRKHETIAPSK